jgi:hypothetical protein
MARQSVAGKLIGTVMLSPVPTTSPTKSPRAGISRRGLVGLMVAAVVIAAVVFLAARASQPLVTPTPTAVLQADVQITLLSSSTAPEYILLQNLGTAPQDMSGWYIESTVGPQTFNFPAGFELAPGASVRLESYIGAKNDPPRALLWSPDAVWNNAGDQALLRNAAGKTIGSKCYGNQCP